jgi:hypothetical protein
MAITLRPFRARDRETWDRFVAASKNGTFLFRRDYLDYHADRFPDASLLLEHQGSLVALLPANRSGDELHSHQGLTYGGLVVDRSMTTPLMLELFGALLAALRAQGLVRLHYKTIPSLYHLCPAEEDRYALFRHDARLSRRDVLAVIRHGARAPVQTRRLRGARKAQAAGALVAGETSDAAWAEYWEVLAENLLGRYGVPPVHSLEEIRRLAALFPENIRLFTIRQHGAVVAGTVLYQSAAVSHVQYIASSAQGRAAGALDLLFTGLIDQQLSPTRPWFDFGISNEQQGRVLNTGLIDMKEGFGARALVHDFYTVDL